MPSSRDPRTYVRPVPLPIPSCKGVKLLARDTINFNPQTPTREVVRHTNFSRRQAQMSAMGFRSLNHKPYLGIGDPFYLDEKKMILYALGQWNEEETSSSSSEEESEDEEEKSSEKKTALSAAKFVLRRSRKDLNTLNKAVVHGRHMIRHVRLGHGLFDLIDKEKENKKLASERALQKRRELLRNEFLPPKTESDDDSDIDSSSDVDLTSYMVPMAPPTFLTQHAMDTDEELGIVNDNTGSDSDQSPEREPDIITFSGMALAEEEEEYVRTRSAAINSAMTSAMSRPVSSRKKKQQTPRPYTPQHTNLSTNISVNMSTRGSVMEEDMEVDITKDALFRQLCVLHWILEAMSTDPPSAMTPITSCWSLSDIGGSRAQTKKMQKDKTTESAWTSFVTKETGRKVNISGHVQIVRQPSTLSQVGKRLSSTRLANRSPHARRSVLVGGRNSTQSSATGSHQGSTTETKPSHDDVTQAVAIATFASLLASKKSITSPISRGVTPEPIQETEEKPASKLALFFKKPQNNPTSRTMAPASPIKTESDQGQIQTNKAVVALKKPNLTTPVTPSAASTASATRPTSNDSPKPRPPILVLDKCKTLSPSQETDSKQTSKAASSLKKPSFPSPSPSSQSPQQQPVAEQKLSLKASLHAKKPIATSPKTSSPTHKLRPDSESTETPKASMLLKKSLAGAPKAPSPTPTGPASKPKQNILGGFFQRKFGGLNNLANQMTALSARNRDDDHIPLEEEEDQAYNKSIFKFLDEYYESLKTEEEGKGGKDEDDNKSSLSDSPPAQSPDQKKDKKHKGKDEEGGKKSRRKKGGQEEPKRLEHKVAVALGEEEKMSSKYLRANAHLIRPKSSPALIEFQQTLPSSKRATMSVDLHNSFAESREEKALTLHDILDHKESQRRTVCQSKFVSLQGLKQRSSFHRAVEDMRVESWQRLRKPVNDRKKSSAKGNWYTDLMEKIPEEIKQEWYYMKILQKLGNFGLVEGTGKQSIYKFLKVLQGLREWEICSPDVVAAIEFCRESIVEMTVEEYEMWFRGQFPRVNRPQTAPPTTKGDKKDGGACKDSSKTGPPRRNTQSAAPRRVQR